MSPPDILDILERAKGSARVGDHEEAERLLKTYLSKNPENREAHLLLGTTLAKEQKLPEAEDEFNILLGKNPRDIEALNNIAVVYRLQGKLQDALAVLVEAIDLEPAKAEFHYNIGNIHKQLGNLKAASMAYARVVELDPAFVPAYNNLGTIYDQLKEYDRAFAVFRKGLALDRNNPTLHFNYGVALEANGLLKEAAEEYQSSIRSKPGWLDPMNNLGIVLFKQGQHGKAMATFNRILAADPLNAEARNNMGVVLADQGRTKEAIQSYRQAIEADPKYMKAVVNLERVLEDSGSFADAIVELEKLIKLNPQTADARTRLAGLYLKMDRCPEALEEARAALEQDPENTQALRVKGTALRVMGKDVEAKAVFEKILALDPGNDVFLLDLADIHFKRKEYKEAEQRINAFLARRPKDREAKLLLGRLYTETGNRTHALQIFEELARADPNDTEALAAAAELHKDAGAIEKALRTADTLVNVQGKRATADDLSELNKSLEFYENAVSAYSSSVQEMWDRNIKLALGSAEAEAGEPGEDDMSLLLGAAGMAPAIDEETETLFIEDAEPDEDIIGEEYLEPLDDPLPLFDEEDNSLDNMADLAAPISPIFPTPSQATPPAPQDGVPAEPEFPPVPPEPSSAPQSGPPPVPPPSSAPQSGPSAEPDPAAAEPPAPPPWPQMPQYPPYYPPPVPPPAPAEEPVEEEAPFPGTAPEHPSEELPFDDEERGGDLSGGGGADDVGGPGEETGEEADFSGAAEENPEDEIIFGEEEPEDLWGPPAGDETPDEEILPAFADEPEASLPVEEAPAEEAPEPESAAPPSGEPPAEPADENESPELKKDDMLGLMNYLKALTEALPDEARNEYMRSQARLNMERIIDTLEGRQGFIKKAEACHTGGTEAGAPEAPRQGGKMAALRAAADAKEAADKAAGKPRPQSKKPDLAGMLAFIAKLASAVPNSSLGKTISRKVDKVIAGIKKSEKSGENRD
ncbi:MAG: tetratricopeptide repeat protein [Treponema sp.]|jgi:tetratricopeptide (TPR) repeat protein|nr:tetratricopeptide repeat protein [Treponema sp.]